jgi:pimeloyl-ACP methyl ester carboxylesterase
MATFVLVHGAWHGAWCWDRVTRLLTAAGHRVSAPTLSGLGERRNDAPGHVRLDTHIEDVTDHLWFHGLDDVVLVAHSYAGFVAGGVVARASERIARLVLLDGFVPRTDEAMAHHVGERGAAYRAEAERDPDWRIPPPPLAALGVTDPADVAWAEPRLTAQPVRTYLEPVGPVDLEVVADRLYIACTAPALPVLETSRARVREAGWPVAELAAGHDAMVTHPREIADLVAASS